MPLPTSVGVLGLGVHLPEEIRTNDFWPPEFRQKFEERSKRDVLTPEVLLGRARSAAQRIQMEQMLETYHDPFRGAVERRVAPADQPTSQMELLAAREACTRAGVDPRELDLVITYSLPADHYVPTNTGVIAQGLGAGRALAMTVDTGCSSFNTAFQVADSMVKSGQARKVLIATSFLGSRFNDYADPGSVNFGDGAAAAVVGAVPEGRGFLGHASRTVSELHDGVTIDPKHHEPWWQTGGPFYLHSKNVERGRQIILGAAEFAAEAAELALRRAGLERKEITHFYSHQGSVFFNRACRLAAGLEHAKTTDTFRQYGALGAAPIPLNMYFAQQSGQLQPGDTVLTFACGAGLTWTSCIVRM